VIVLGLLPIMVFNGTGSEIMQRISAPLIGGMITAPIVSMILIPIFYYLINRLQFKNNKNQESLCIIKN